MIRPIQTLYSGILFRSRLEARWAMYFDLLGVEWIYELEGFDLGNGMMYLPDFFLPLFNVYCEVKPFSQDDVRWEKFCSGGSELVLLIGKVHCQPCWMVKKKRGCVIPHIDSAIANGKELWYGKGLEDENQQFCDEANSYRF